ncbi:MAG TPA: hypothetical protein VKV25_00530 [Acidimicrobiales bacterium]|nr:hypothetical protein [Acidimicrobiales bacterium]
MTQPDYVPVQPSDRIRPSERLAVPGSWWQDRPAEQQDLQAPTGPRFGTTGPDLGYGLKLAKRFHDRLRLAPGEDVEDAIVAGFACGARRAASLGRAPVVYDMEWAYTLLGYLGDAPDDLVAARTGLVRGAAHDYWNQRRVVDAVRDEALLLTPAQVRDRLGDWRSLIDVG